MRLGGGGQQIISIGIIDIFEIEELRASFSRPFGPEKREQQGSKDGISKFARIWQEGGENAF